MSYQPLILSGTPDTLPAGGTKINANFVELYGMLNTVGYSLGVSNPTIGGDANERRGISIAVTYNSGTASNPNFSNLESVKILQNSNVGQNVYGGGTDAKKTFIPLWMGHDAPAAGQRFMRTMTANYYGMGDAFLESNSLHFAGANIGGDEGAGFCSVSYVRQQQTLVRPTISSVPTQATGNTTITPAITKSSTAQTVAVGSTTGIQVNDWYVIGQEAPSGHPNLEVVQITAVGGGTITAVFLNNHDAGVTLTPALVLNLSGSGQLGEQRVLVNHSGTTYSTGTVSSIVGGGFIGSGTSWAANMVGGTATNIGAVSLDSDEYTGEPFQGSGNSGPLRSWYQIASVADTTHLGIFSWTVAGAQDYRGQGVGTIATYKIRPAARILRISGTQVICETSTHTWTAADQLECVIAPYPDVTGFQHVLSTYTNGGSYRAYSYISNRGARKFETCFDITSNLQTGGGASTLAWGTVLKVDAPHEYGLLLRGATLQGIRLYSNRMDNTQADDGGRIGWGALPSQTAAYIGPDSPNEGMKFKWIQASGTTGVMSAVSSVISGESQHRIDWDGSFTFTGYMEITEMTEPAAPAANKARLYTKDVGGKTALMVRFPTGSVVQLAIEP